MVGLTESRNNVFVHVMNGIHCAPAQQQGQNDLGAGKKSVRMYTFSLFNANVP